AAPATWPTTIDLDEAMIELGWDTDRAVLGKALVLVGLRETGGVQRVEWERYWPRVVRQLGRGTPVLPLDQVARETYTSDPRFVLKGRTLDFETMKEKAKFYGGDKFAIEMEASRNAQSELLVFNQFRQYDTYKPPQPLTAGKP